MVQRVAMLSVHTCPLAMPGSKETGGMNVYIKELTTELDKRGITVDVFTRSQEPGTPTIHGILGERSRVIHIPTGPEVPYNKNKVYHYLPEFVDGIKNRVSQENLEYDIIHSHYWLSGLAAEQLRYIWGGLPTIQMFHTLGEMKNRFAQAPSEREIPLRTESERAIMQSADRLIAATPIESKDLVDLYGADSHKIEIIPPGVNLNIFNSSPENQAPQEVSKPQNHNMILFVGRIQPLKGIDTLIRAIAIVLKRHLECKDNICLTIIGGDLKPGSESERTELERLQRLKEDLGIGNLVTFLGAKAQNNLVHYYSEAQMVVMPSHYESFGMVAIEAMACGTPVIASDVGGLTYTIKDGFNGYLVPREDHNALADKISLLLKSPDLREQLGKQARQWVKRFSWSNIADKMLAVYKRVLLEQT